MLETTTVYVTPVALHRGSSGGPSGSSSSSSSSNRADFWMLRVAIVLLASSRFAASSSTGEEFDAEISGSASHPGGSGASSQSKFTEESVGVVMQGLASGKFDTNARSLLESLLASLDALLAEFGLPSASVVCAALALAILAFAFVRKVGISGGGGVGGVSSKKRKGVVLFLGPCGSGKTSMCYKLCHDMFVPTVTSMQASKFDCRRVIGGGGPPSASMVDYPGHERLRGGVREELRNADRVVFVLDGSCLAAQIAAAGELLFDVLTDPSLEGCRGLMLALNKSDVKEAKTSRAKTLLQKELDKLRGTRGTLGTQGDEDDMPFAMALGRPGQPFSLEVDSPCEVVIAACSVVSEGGLEPVAEFVRASAR